MRRPFYLLLLLFLPAGCSEEPFTFYDWTGQTSDRYRIWDADLNYGYMDAEGSVVIPIQYTGATDFVHGAALIESCGNSWAIDLNGDTLIPPGYKLGEFSGNGLFPASENGRNWGYINRQGEVAIPFEYYKSWTFLEGLGRVSNFYHFGFVDRSGNLVIDFDYGGAGYFNNGRAYVVDADGTCGYIDASGELVIPFQYEDVLMFTENLAGVVLDSRCGYIDPAGDLVIENIYEDANYFTEGLAAVSMDGLWGYINRKGEWVVEPAYEAAGIFSDGLARVKRGGLWGFITPEGTFAIAPGYEEANSFINGLALVYGVEEGLAYIKPSGAVVYAFPESVSLKKFAVSSLFSQTPEEEMVQRILRKN